MKEIITKEFILIEFFAHLYALYCQTCEKPQPVEEIKFPPAERRLVCMECKNTLGITMPRDYIKHMMEGGERH